MSKTKFKAVKVSDELATKATATSKPAYQWFDPAGHGIVMSKKGLWIRPETSDRYVEGQVRDYKFNYAGGPTVLDLGANIGAFSAKAFKEGAGKVIAVEPMPTSFFMLAKNTVGKNVVLLQAACVNNPSAGPDMDIFVSKAHTMCSLYKIKGRGTMKVPVIQFQDLLDKHKPAIIKIDVEGSEFELMQLDMPDYVKQMAVEFTFTKKMLDPEAKVREIYDRYVANGWTFLGHQTVDGLLPSVTPKKGFFVNGTRTCLMVRP